MRSHRRARWATCALALTLSLPVAADHKSLSSCTSFDQQNKDDDKVAFTIANTCTVPIDCRIEWRLVCSPESKKRREVHPGAAKLALTDGSQQTTEASAAICGDDAWQIDSVEWSCEPNKD